MNNTIHQFYIKCPKKYKHGTPLSSDQSHWSIICRLGNFLQITMPSQQKRFLLY
eukprot:CCRYP_016404-RA/>CCRYP_016404-RA protein AED:0.00 eAED:0.00 QI:131/1/0.5/1/0/0/2/0/53